MRVRIGYQLSITALFVGVVLTVGLVLVILSFDRARSITRSAAMTYIDRVAQHTADRVDGQFKDVLGTLEVLQRLPAVENGTIADNAALYGVLAALLRQHDQLYNLYVGYDDGRFIELDALDRAGPAARAQVGAPAGAAFRLVVIDRRQGGETRIRSTAFLSSELTTVAQAQRAADYDPRDRPWYRDAFEPGAAPVTPPYVFKVAALTGYTVRVPFSDGRRGIVAGDILLRDADAFLRAQKLGKSGVVFLFDGDGRVVAHPRMSEFLQSRPADDALELPRIDQIESIDLAIPLKGWTEDDAAPQVFDAAGRTYVAAFRAIPTAGQNHLRVAVMAPLDEFFAEIEAERGKLLALALAFVLATVPVVWGIGSVLSRSMRALALETDRIQRFDLEGPAKPVTSRVREIDDLGRSIFTMRAVAQTFSRFAPTRLVEQLIETGNALQLGGTRREVTVMFSDIEGFTSITENADPEQVMIQTSRYFAALSAAIMEHGGTIDKFVGDGIMAIWNAPADDPDHVAHACAAAEACRKASRDLNTVLEQEGRPAFRTRFGLHTGNAVVGTIGSVDRMSYTALGATVNLAARLEALNKDYGTEVLVSEAVRRQAAHRCAFRPIATVTPRGFNEAIQVFELCSCAGPEGEGRR